MQLNLMQATAWTFTVIGAIGFFRYKKGEELWARRFYGGLTIVAGIQILVLARILNAGFLNGTLVLPSVLFFCTLVCLSSAREKVFAAVAFYASVLQFLVAFEVLSGVA
ncbi:MAG: hypothetical protein ACE5F1_18085, partial [Planctomycetota bacterium]